MDTKDFEEDFKYLVGFGLCASVKYFSPYGIDMIVAAEEIKKNKYTKIGRAVALISEFKINSALSLLADLHKENKQDETINALLNFVRTLVVSVIDRKDMTVDSSTHKKVKVSLKEKCENAESYKDEYAAELSKDCSKILETGLHI